MNGSHAPNRRVSRRLLRTTRALVALLAPAVVSPLACAPRATSSASTVEAAAPHPAGAAPPTAQDPYADLAPLGAAIGDARVVALGEPLHAVGNIDAEGARLVSYLHDRLGFTVLAWEAGLWSCEDDATRCLGFPWGSIEETRGLRDVPPALGMHVTGFDVQFTGPGATIAQQHLRDKMITALGSARSELAGRLTAAFGRLPKAKRFRKMTAEERDVDLAAFREALPVIEALPRSREDDLLARAVKNVIALYKWHEDVRADVSIDMDWNHHTELNNRRDEGMAENVLWLLQQHPKERVVLWAANMHLAKNVSLIKNLRGPEFDDAMARYDTMGTRLAEALGRSYFTVAMTAYGGSVGHPPEEAVRAVTPARADSFEGTTLPDAGASRFVKLDPANDALQRARFLGLTDYSAPWSRVFDSAIVFRAVTPATPEATPASPDAGR